MTEFGFDITLTATVRVKADSLADAVDFLRENLQDYMPGDYQGHQIPVGGTRIEQALITELSLGTLIKGKPQEDLMLFEADGEGFGDRVPMDGMTTPVLCQGFPDAPGCETVYDESGGDGYGGDCPSCADRKWAAEQA